MLVRFERNDREKTGQPNAMNDGLGVEQTGEDLYSKEGSYAKRH